MYSFSAAGVVKPRREWKIVKGPPKQSARSRFAGRIRRNREILKGILWIFSGRNSDLYWAGEEWRLIEENIFLCCFQFRKPASYFLLWSTWGAFTVWRYNTVCPQLKILVLLTGCHTLLVIILVRVWWHIKAIFYWFSDIFSSPVFWTRCRFCKEKIALCHYSVRSWCPKNWRYIFRGALRDKMGNGTCLLCLFETENHKQKREDGTDI